MEKLYLVTGGSGFLGIPLVERLLKHHQRVRVLARDEGKLVDLKQKFPQVEILTGDISDSFEVKQAMQGVNGVFHLAASKHVGLAEKQVRECLKSNTIGSLNLLDASLDNNLDFLITTSTDKAAQVAGVYGATKFLTERLFKQYEALNPSCKYRVVRYGNVLYSTGSVLCKWKDLLQEGGIIKITDPDATRFFWTVDQAVDLIFECLYHAENADPYVPEMKGMRLGNILDAMILKYGAPKHVEILGLQPGENLHEKILENGKYSNEVDQFTVEEILELI